MTVIKKRRKEQGAELMRGGGHVKQRSMALPVLLEAGRRDVLLIPGPECVTERATFD